MLTVYAGSIDDEAIFEQVFGKKMSRSLPSVIPVLVMIGGQPLRIDDDEAMVSISLGDSEDKARIIKARLFLEMLKAEVIPEVITDLEKRVSANQTLSLADINQTQLKAAFDFTSLQLNLTIPAKLRAHKFISVESKPQQFTMGKLYQPATISGYFNAHTGIEYFHSNDVWGQTGRQPLRLALDAALNVKGVVLEANGYYDESAKRHWQRGNIRLVVDNQKNQLRYALGDLRYAAIDFQNTVPLGGVSISRNWNLLRPGEIVYPRGKSSFILETEAQVDVFLNDTQIRSLRLLAGTYTLQDFNLFPGINDIRLQITNKIGQVSTLYFSQFFDTHLLREGKDEFSVNLGFPSFIDKGLRKYDRDNLSFSGFYRRGFSSNLTLGINLQGNKQQQLLGLDILHTSVLGSLQYKIGSSHLEALGNDFSASVQHHYEFRYKTNWDFLVRYWGEDFAPLGTTQPHNLYKYNISARLSQQLPWEINASLGSQYHLARHDKKDSHSSYLRIKKQLGRGQAAVSLEFRQNKNNNGRIENSLFLSLHWHLGKNSRQFLYGTYDSYNERSQINWSLSPEYPVGAIGANLSIANQANSDNVSGYLSYNTSQTEMGLSYDFTKNDNSSRQQRANFSLGSSLVYADGIWALSRPVNDSFAIFIPHKSLKDHFIGIEPIGQDGYMAETNTGSTMVLPTLSAYYHKMINISTPDVPIGYDLNDNYMTLLPSYRSGTLVQIGSEPGILLDGTLLTAAGEPLVLQVGELRQRGQPAGESNFFTSKKGRFRISGIKPGDYEIHLIAYPDNPIAIHIPPNSPNPYKIGAVRLSPLHSEN
jgi:outer membrane usher protein